MIRQERTQKGWQEPSIRTDVGRDSPPIAETWIGSSSHPRRARSGRADDEAETRVVFLERAERTVPAVPTAIRQIARDRRDHAVDDRSRHPREAGSGGPRLGVEHPLGVRQKEPSIQSGESRWIGSGSTATRPPSHSASRSGVGKIR